MKIGTTYKFFRTILIPICLFATFLGQQGCEEPEKSPGPGILEVHLKSQTTRYLPSNSARYGFIVSLGKIYAYRDSRVFFEVFSDLRATQRSTSQLEILDSLALNGEMIIGESYIPPGKYSQLTVKITPNGFSFYNGSSHNVPVQVIDTREIGNEVMYFPASIPVIEGRKTIVTVTANIDSSLTPSIIYNGNDNPFDIFLYNPKFSLSSVTVH